MCASVFAWAKTDTRATLERPLIFERSVHHEPQKTTPDPDPVPVRPALHGRHRLRVGSAEHGQPQPCACEGLRDNCTDPAHSEGNHGSVTFATELRQDGNTLYIGDQVWTYEHNVGYILPAGTYYLGTDLTLDHQIRISNSREVKVTLCLNGKTITCTENYDAVIQTPTTYPVEFTLCDCRPSDSVGKITHANGIRGVGVELKNNNAVNDVAHKFIMYNGCITGNKTTHGAGVFLYSNTTFTMYGGSITENECNSDTYLPCGGGVYAFTNATFTMYGGDITKNKADYGGGVSTSGDTANFTMYGGSITENHANKSGGGIYSNSNNISIYGGSVTDNSVTKNGKAGGIYVSSSDTLTVGGNVNISGNWQGDSKESGSKSNVYLNGNTSGSSATIVIENKLTGAPIGVTTANAPTAGNPVTIVTGNSIEETYKDSFQADNAAYGVSYNSTDKVLQLHKHSGGTATCMAPAVCTTCGQPYGNTNPNNHDLEHHEAKAATCTEVGWNAYNTCKREGCSYTTYKEIAALNHALVHHEAQAPTCTAVGWEAYDTCSRCSYTTKVEKQKTPHTYGETWVKGQDGHWKVCEVCKGRSEVKPHDWKDATTSAPKTCTVCGATTGTKLSTYYYYSPAKTEDTPGSPKAGDPGVLLYAGLALASLTGLACTAKKRH